MVSFVFFLSKINHSSKMPCIKDGKRTMTKKNRRDPIEEEYLLKYGDIPSDEEARLAYVLNKYNFTEKSLDKALCRLDNLEWKTVEFTLFLVPMPTPRPRYDGNHFYVRGAARNKKMIKRFIERHIIYTRCEIYIEAYLPTPTSLMSNAEIYLAEMKKIFPVGSADVDNLMKTYMDMIQGHLLLNDNIVTLGHLEKFYSVKPRLVIFIRYQDGFDSHFNEKRMTNTSAYKMEFGDQK